MSKERSNCPFCKEAGYSLASWDCGTLFDAPTFPRQTFARRGIDCLQREIASLKAELERTKISRDDWKQCAKLQEESLHLAKWYGRTACYLALEWLDDVCDPKSSLATTEGVIARQRIEHILLELGGSAEAE